MTQSQFDEFKSLLQSTRVTTLALAGLREQKRQITKLEEDLVVAETKILKFLSDHSLTDPKSSGWERRILPFLLNL